MAKTIFAMSVGKYSENCGRGRNGKNSNAVQCNIRRRILEEYT